MIRHLQTWLTGAGKPNLCGFFFLSIVSRRDCSEHYKAGVTRNGQYFVDPDGKGRFKVYCDMTTDGGGWTVFQRRQDGSQDFYLGWDKYKVGFGQLTGEFWLGLDKIHRLTASRPVGLRVEMEDWSGGRVYAKYGSFDVGDEESRYKLSVDSYSGSAGDSLTKAQNGMAFSTKDRDHDRFYRSCAELYQGAWWYKWCAQSSLNGPYKGSNHWKVYWFTYKGGKQSLKFVEMKLKPKTFSQ